MVGLPTETQEDLDEMFFENETEEDVVSLIVAYIKENEGQFGK